MVSLPQTFELSHLLVVDEDVDVDPHEFSAAVESADTSHILFLRDGVPAALSATAHLTTEVKVDIGAVRESRVELHRTHLDPDSDAPLEIYYGAAGAVVLHAGEPYLRPPVEPREGSEDVVSLLASPAALAVAADTRLPGPQRAVPVPVEILRCPGPERHWVPVPQDDPVCPTHHIRLR
jgi:hypothetical protein